jgi:hypothetical protein
MRLRTLLTLGLTMLVTASCHNATVLAPKKFVDSFTKGMPQLSLHGIGPGGIGGSPNNPIQRTRGRTEFATVSFSLSTPSGQPIHGGSPQVYITRENDVIPLGPYDATWSPFDGYAQTGDHSPRTSAPGVYYVRVQFPWVGVEIFLATSPQGREHGVAQTIMYVDGANSAAVGTKATSVKTPVATTAPDLERICSRQPPDPIHAMSLDDALTSHKPTVVAFSSPGRGASAFDSVVTDEVLVVDQRFGSRANFVHADTVKDASAFEAWRFPDGSGPWVIVIDKHGVIRARFEGGTTAPMIEEALKPLL